MNFFHHKGLGNHLLQLCPKVVKHPVLSRLFFLRMRNVADKSCRENQNTHFVFNTFFFSRLENHAVHDIVWKNIVDPDRPQMTIWRMRIACCIPKSKNTHSQYVMLIALPLQQWLQEPSSMLRYTYIVCLVLELLWAWERPIPGRNMCLFQTHKICCLNIVVFWLV